MHQGFIVPTEDTFSEGILAYQLMASLPKATGPISTPTRLLSTSFSASTPTASGRRACRWPPAICLDYIGDRPRDPRPPALSPKANADEYRKSIRLAANWIANARSYNNEDRSWRVAGLAWAGTNKAAMQQAVKELLAAQHPKVDGQLPTSPSTAYATGRVS